MSRKKVATPFAMPTREATVDAWVAGTPATPTMPASEMPATPAPGAPAAKPARLTIDLPVELHTRFKAACAIGRVQMVDVVRDAIEAWVQNNGKL